MSTTGILVCALPTKIQLKAPYLVSEDYLAQLLNRPKSRTSKKVLFYQQHNWRLVLR